MNRQKRIRSGRRHHLYRQRRRAERILKQDQMITEEEAKTAAVYRADHLSTCSCDMCGNPRKHWKEETLQEKKSNIDFKEQLDELGPLSHWNEESNNEDDNIDIGPLSH